MERQPKQPSAMIESLEERRLFAHVLVAVPDVGRGIVQEQSLHLKLRAVGENERPSLTINDQLE